MEVTAAADEHSNTTGRTVVDFVISSALQLAALLVYLQIYLIKLCAVIINSLCPHLLSSLNQIFPSGSRIHSVHHYMNEFEALATAYVDDFVAKCNQIYLLLKQSVQIQFMEASKIVPSQTIHSYLNKFETLAKAYLDYFVAKYCEIYPPVKRYILIKLEELIGYIEARKQEELIKSKSWIERFVSENPAVAGCVAVAIGLIFVRLCCGRRSHNAHK